MSQVSISKSLMSLVGMESYARTKQKAKDIETSLKQQKDKIINPDKVRERHEHEKDKSQSAEKERKYLEEHGLDDQKLQRREMDQSLRWKVATKLGIRRRKDSTRQELEGGSPAVGPKDGVSPAEGKR